VSFMRSSTEIGTVTNPEIQRTSDLSAKGVPLCGAAMKIARPTCGSGSKFI